MNTKIFEQLTRAVVLSRDAMLTVSPNKQYWGVFSPTKPAATGPECIPGRQQVKTRKIKFTTLSSISLKRV